MMGPGTATSAALAGHSVVSVHRSAASADRAHNTIRRNLSQLLDGKLIDRNQVDRALEAVRIESDLKRGLQGSFWIIESIDEGLSEKQKLFKLMDSLSQSRDRFVMQTLRFFHKSDPSKKGPVEE